MGEPFKMSLEDVADAVEAFGDRLPAIIKNCPDIVDYQVPKKGDRIATSDGQEWICPPGSSIDAPFSSKYFIRRPRKKVAVTDYVFKATGEVRVPQPGEWYRSPTFRPYVDAYLKAHPSESYTTAREIYSREEISREIEVDE